MKEKLDITVLCITYNHIKFIRKTLDGFLRQKGNFTYKIIIHDDASTDGTQDVLLEYKERYPDKIKLILQKENQYSKINVKILDEYLYPIIESKYVAFCEGDDYWLYDYKLQKQFEWMESHPNTTLCVHNAIRFDENAKEVLPQVIDMNTGYMDDEEIILCKNGRIPSASFFYRAEYLKNRPAFFGTCPVGDDPLRWWLAYNGDVYYMDKVWSVRNYMHEGSWNRSMVKNQDFKMNYVQYYIDFLFEFDKETNYRFHDFVETCEYNQCMSNVVLGLGEKYYCEDLRFKVDKCQKCNCDKAKLLYEKIFILIQRNCTDYLTKVFEIAKENVDRFFIYGAGQEAKKYAEILADNGIEFAGFVVSKKQNEQTELMEHAVKCLDEIENRNEAYFWLCMNYQNRNEVFDNLQRMGISKII